MKRFFFIMLVAILFSSCTTIVHFLSTQQDISLYVNEEFIGYGQVTYVVPKGGDYVTVSCRIDGVEVYSRSYYVKHQNSKLFEIIVPENYKYSNNPIIFKSH